MPKPISQAFRNGLAQELPEWVERGFVSPEQGALLRAEYALDAAAAEQRGWLWWVIYVFGSLLVGLGVIALVASQWGIIPRWPKVALLLGAMLGAYAAAWHAYARTEHRPWLGHSMVLLGNLIFGASIGLFGQIFHLDGSYAAGFGAWAIGTTLMAYASGSPPSAGLALVASSSCFVSAGEHGPWMNWYTPILLLQGVPFALWYKSAPIFALTIFGMLASECLFALDKLGLVWAAYSFIALGAALGGAGAWLMPDPAWRRFARVGIFFGVTAYAAGMYLLSWGWYEHSFTRAMSNGGQFTRLATLIAIAASVAAATWIPTLRRTVDNQGARALAVGILPGAILIGLCALRATYPWLFLTSNVALLILGASLVWCGMIAESRSAYWAGVLVLATEILTRFLHTETLLLTKGVVCIASGVAVLYAGLKFERQFQRKRNANVH